MILTSSYLITDYDKLLSQTAKEANNLYNLCLYHIRQNFIKKHKLNNYSYYDKLFKNMYKNKENMLYHKLQYVQSAQQTIKEVVTTWSNWLKALKAYYKNPAKFTGKPRMPYYLDKGHKHIFYVTNQNAINKHGYLIIKKLNLKLKLIDNIGKIKRVAFKPEANRKFTVLVQYEVPDKKLRPDNNKYIGVDPGLDNAFTCVTNGQYQPLIINGKGIKSVNQLYNKKISDLKAQHVKYHQCCKTIYSQKQKKSIEIYSYSKSMYTLTDWRNQKVKEFAHKATKSIIDYALNCGANTIVVGYNKYQKRSANMGKKTNQNFIGIPHSYMIKMLEYKAKLTGLNVIKTNESYTSQTSFLDNEKPCKQNGNYARKQKSLSPIKRRIKRGLFKSNKGILINADVNGALQIIKKEFPKFRNNDGIERFVLNPIKLNIKF